MTFEESVVIQQPVINGTDIVFYVSTDTKDENLKLKPVIKTSDKATVVPASGEEVDFSVGSVEFIVTAEDGVTQTTYKVSCQKVGKYDFEEWVEEMDGETPLGCYLPIGEWGSSNKGVIFLMYFDDPNGDGKLTDKFAVTYSGKEDAYVGNKAARIETLDTKGLYTGKFLPNIPKVTTGTLFLGSFDIESALTGNILNATKFGIPYKEKPLRIKGAYKYTSGKDFYEATGMDDCHIAKLNNDRVDECAINAILYVIENDDDPYLTGANAYDENNGKLVARAELKDGAAKNEYTSFDLEFEYKYGKTYDPNKKYRLAIICASSKWSDTFSGAPGSVLYVDDIEIISE